MKSSYNKFHLKGRIEKNVNFGIEKLKDFKQNWKLKD